MAFNGSIEEYMFLDLSFNAKMILDAGTGNGIFTTKLVQLVSKAKGDRKIFSVDIDEKKFENVKSRLKGNQSNIIEFVKADLSSLSFIDDNTFDIIFCHHIIHIINSRPLKAAQALYEFHRVLKPEGILVINENYPANGSHYQDYLNFINLKKLKTLLFTFVGKQLSPRIYPEDLSYILKKIGFSKTDVKAFQDQAFPPKIFDLFFNEIKDEIQKLDDYKFKEYCENKLNSIKQAYGKNPGMIPPQYVIKLVK